MFEIIAAVPFRTFRLCPLAACFFGTFQRFQGPARGHRRTGKATLGRLVNPPLLVNPPVIPGQGRARARGPAKEKEKRRVTADMNRELSLETGRGGRAVVEVAVVDIGNYFDLRLPGPWRHPKWSQNGRAFENGRIYPISLVETLVID